MSLTTEFSTSLLPDGDIVKQGYLYIKRPPRHGIQRFKTWHKRYFVLRDESNEHSRRLEMYLKEIDFTKGGARKFVLDLKNVVHVGRTSDSKRFHEAFIIVCLERSPVLLADEDSLSLNSWLLAVSLIAEKGHSPTTPSGMPFGSRSLVRRRSCELPDCLEGVPLDRYYSEMKLEDSTAEKFDVTIQPTEASNRNDLRGDYQLMIHSWGLSLLKPGRDDYIVHWPLCFIRKYKNEMLGLSPKRKTTLVTLELGRRCATGEGILKFRTQQGREIVNEITQVIASSMSRKMTSDMTRQQWLSSGNHSSGQKGPWSQEFKLPSSVRNSTSGVFSLDRMSMDNSSSNTSHRKVVRSESEGLRGTLESTSSMTSSTSTSSGESAEYIMAAFSEQTHGLHFDTNSGAKGLRATRSTNDIAAYTSLSAAPLNHEEAKRQRILRAEAEGYLEVLPDYFEGEKASEERNNIYHNMDFSDNKKEPGKSNDSSEHGKVLHRRKPPAPLPRPDHTIPELAASSFRRIALSSPSHDDRGHFPSFLARRSDPYPQPLCKSDISHRSSLISTHKPEPVSCPPVLGKKNSDVPRVSANGTSANPPAFQTSLSQSNIRPIFQAPGRDNQLQSDSNSSSNYECILIGQTDKFTAPGKENRKSASNSQPPMEAVNAHEAQQEHGVAQQQVAASLA